MFILLNFIYYGGSHFDIESLIIVTFLFWLPLIFIYPMFFSYMLSLLMRIFTGEKHRRHVLKNCDLVAISPRIFVCRRAIIYTRIIAAIFPILIFPILMLWEIGARGGPDITFCFLASHIACAIGELLKIRRVFSLSKDALINDVGFVMAVFEPSEGEEAADEATAEYLDWLESKGADIPEKHSRDDACNVSIAVIVLLTLALLVTGSLTFIFNMVSLKYPRLSNITESVTFYIFLAFSLLLIYCIKTIDKHRFFKILLCWCLIFAALPGTFICMLLGNSFSYTEKIENYGVYDDFVAESINDIFPTEITDEMTPIRYSYCYDISWDPVYEVYLEVKLTDSAYAELRSKYESEIVAFPYAEGFSEYVISDDMQAGDDYISSPNVCKIIFSDTDNTVIYEMMYGFDPFYFKNSAYIDRFDIDPRRYGG